MKKDKQLAVINSYYESKTSSDYNMGEIQELIDEYGANYFVELIRRVCLKRHERKKMRKRVKRKGVV